MNCLIKSQYKKELSHYKDMLGSEEAAYYVLAMNNGYTLDKNPDGSPSSLYSALLLYHGGNEALAVLNMSVVFTPAYMGKYGDWTEGFNHKTGSLEPSIVTLQGEGLCDNTTVKLILGDTADISRFGLLEQANELSRSELLEDLLQGARAAEIAQKMADFELLNPTATEEQKFYARKQFEREFNVRKIQESIAAFALYIASEFPDNDSLKDFLATLQQRIQEGGIEMRNSELQLILMNLVRKVLTGEDLSTSVYEFAETYIKAFQDSEVVQEAMHLVGDQLGTKSQERILSELAKIVTGKVTKDKRILKQQAVREFWWKFRRFLKKVFTKNKPYNFKSNVLDTVTIAFSSNEHLALLTDEEILYDRRKLELNKGSHETTMLDILKAMRDGAESRIKSIKSISGSVNKDELYRLENLVQQIDDAKIYYGNKKDDTDIQIITEFVKLGIREIGTVTQRLDVIDKALNEVRIRSRYKNTTVENSEYSIEENQLLPTIHELMKIKTDVVGFYSSITINWIFPYLRNAQEEDLLVGSALRNTIDDIRKLSDDALKLVNDQIRRYSEYVVDRIADEYVDTGDKERFKLNAKKHLKNRINHGDLPWIELIIGSGISSQSPIVRMADIIIREINHSVSTEGYTRGMKLLKLYDKSVPTLSKFMPYNYQRNFVELDEDGKPTGFFVSPIKEGVARKNIKDLKLKLNKKYGIAEVNPKTHMPVAFESKEQWRDYMEEYDKGLEDLGIHRRFVADYYIMLRKFMNQDTIAELNRLNKQIGKLYDRCYDEQAGVAITLNLSKEDQDKLKDLLREKEAISNPYDIRKDEGTGEIVQIKQKEGDALRMAEEIKAWNKYKALFIDYKEQREKFNRAHQAIINKYGKGSNEEKLFLYQSVTKKIQPEYYDTISSILGSRQSSDELDKLLAKRNAIIESTKAKKGFYEPDLSKLNDEAWAILKELDEKISKERNRLVKGVLTNDQLDAYRNLVEERWVLNADEGKNYITWLYDLAEAQLVSNPAALQEFNNKYYYLPLDADGNPSGNILPLSIFKYSAPKDIAKFVTDDALVGVFSEIDENSHWVDKKFDPTLKTSQQYDADKYRNEKYYELTDPNNKNYNKDVHAFYKEVLNIMDEAWKLLPNVERLSKYQMPQRRADGSELAQFTEIYSRTKAVLHNEFQVNENDTNYNEEYTRRPDGTIVNTIPIRWVLMLDDPTAISTDLTRTVIEFYTMALEFSKKSEKAPVLEMLRALLENTSRDVDTSDQTRRLAKHLEMYLYGKRRAGFNKGRKMGKTEQLAAKISAISSSVAHSKFMPKNLVGMFKNANDSFFSLMAEAVAGRHFTMADLKDGIKALAKEICTTGFIFSAGRATVRTWTTQAMQYAGISGTIAEIFGNLNETWFRRVMETHFSMGEYTLIDYMFKGLITNMAYHSRRLLRHPETGKYEFMTRQRAEFVFGRKAGREAWKKSPTTLKDAYQINEEGVFELKPEFKDIVRPEISSTGRRSGKTELQVNTLIKERSAVINGMLNEMDRNGMSQNYLGAMVLLMRGWLVTQIQDYTKTGHDFAVFGEDDDKEITRKNNKAYDRFLTTTLDAQHNQIIEENEEFAGQFNFGTGVVEKGYWFGLLKAYWRWSQGGAYLRHILGGYDDLTDHQMYLVRRCNMAILALAINVGAGTIGKIILEGLKADGAGDDDDEPAEQLKWYFANLIQTFAVASTTERFTQIPYLGFLFTAIELIQNVTVVSSYIKDIPKLFAPIDDLIYMAGQLLGYNDLEVDEETPYDVVKLGNYKGKPKWVKDFAEASAEIPVVNKLGVANAIKSLSTPALQQKASWYNKSLPFPYPMPTYNPKKRTGVWDWYRMYSDDDYDDGSSSTSKKNNKRETAW